MNKRTIFEALKEAREFVRRAEKVTQDDQLEYVAIGCGNKLSGALRRQSMELTRALARMRGAA